MIRSIITKKSRILILLLSISILANAQISVNETGNAANTSAILDVSSTDKGMLIPRMTSVQRAAISTPADGLLVFDTTTDSFWYYNGTDAEWQKVGNVVAGATEINELSDGIYDGSSIFLGEGTGLSDDGVNKNVGIGKQVMYANTSGYRNTAVGNEALRNNTSGYYNTSMGYQALLWNTTGYGNLSIGYKSLLSNGTGFRNTAIGSHALYYNTTGQYNVSMGYNSGHRNSTGISNVTIGHGANNYNQTGNNNTIIGTESGSGNATHNKSGNIFLGYQSGYFETGSNKLYIENSNSATPLIGGDFASDYVDINGDLNLSGSIKIEGGVPGANKILTSDAVGNAVWVTNSAATEINELSDAIYDGSSLFIGESTGVNDDGSNDNIGIGPNALHSNTSGVYNVAMGVNSLSSNESGNLQTAIGYNALSSSTAWGNTSVGSSSLKNTTTGSYNIAFGNGAGFNNVSGAMNIFIGYNAGYNETGGHKLYIENSNSSTPLIGGDFANDSLFFNGVVRITGGNPGANKVLTSDVDGNATWETSSSVSALNDLSDAIYDGSSLFLGVSAGENDNGSTQNVGVGKYALQNNTIGIMNTSAGVYALQTNTSGQNNTAFGNSSLKSNSTGNYNTAMGSTVLQNNTADNNTALGYAAMITNTSGYKNVAVGVNALKLNVNGFYNVAVGYEALKSVQSGTYNSAFGSNSLFNTKGDRNTGSGYYSLFSNTTGSYNTAFGYRSGYENTTGTYNTFLGYNARANNTTAKTNSTAVGNDAVITASNQVRIGNASVTSIGGYAAWTNVSDRQFKSNIKEDVSGLDFILKLRPVTYNLDINLINEFLGVENSANTSAKNNKIQTGFIAQEVEAAAQELGYSFSGVDSPEDEKDHYGLRYAEFVVPLVKAVQELADRNDQLVEIVGGQQEMINQLKQENKELKKIQLEIEELKKSIKKLDK